jgi:arylformamidase
VSKTSRIHDITPRVSPRLAVWPGDVPFSRTLAMSYEQGNHLTLSSINSTVHLGAHVDGPNHYSADGVGIDQRPLELYLGPCQVISVAVGRGERILPEHVRVPISAQRILFHTGTYPDPDDFNEDFASLSPQLVDWLAEQGVRLAGIDTPSIDLCHDKELLSHGRIAAHDMAILEGIVLSDVEPGNYTLVALPLPLEGADASPVRAVLLED